MKSLKVIVIVDASIFRLRHSEEGTILKIYVVCSEDMQPLPNVVIKLFNKNSQHSYETITNEDGIADLALKDTILEYNITAIKHDASANLEVFYYGRLLHKAEDVNQVYKLNLLPTIECLFNNSRIANKFIKLGNIQFEAGKANINADIEPILYDVSDRLKENPNLFVIANTHIDGVNDDAESLLLSRMRFASISTFLSVAGVAEGRVVLYDNAMLPTHTSFYTDTIHSGVRTYNKTNKIVSTDVSGRRTILISA